jgi:DNA modification methylase
MEEADMGPLSKEEIADILSRLEAGEYLPDYLRPRLFRQPREYELAYAAKEPKSEILSNTMAVPLQTVKRFGDAADSTNKLIFGDNLQVLKELLEMKNRGDLANADGSPGVRLCYIDPPFATRQEHTGSQGQRAYKDRVVGAEFVEFLRKRLVFIRELLSADGSLYVHLDEKKSHYVKVVLDEVFGEECFEREIVWRIGWVSGYKTKAENWIRNHDVILYYRRSKSSKEKIFNKEYLPYPEGYVRRDGKPPTGQGFPVEDTWNCSEADRLDSIQIVSFSGEKTGYPTQKNTNLLERIIKTSSNEGDLVLDCFLGSGTTAVAAERLGRRWIGIDSGKFAIYTAQHRLLSEAGNGGQDPGLSTTSFEVCAAGLYDNALLEQLDFAEYEAFAVELFGARKQPHDVGGIPMTGSRSGDPVHVFPYDATDADMGVEYLESLERRMSGRHSGPCYVIAPASRCDPGLFEDVLRVGEISFFILRIPYSIIEALHQRRFEKLRQPHTEGAINDPIDAFGFDFVQPPHVEATVAAKDGYVKCSLQAFYRGGLDPDDRKDQPDAGRTDLAMVMTDRDYNGNVFDITDYWFGETLAANDWSFSLPLTECGKTLMLLYVDIHGNEFRAAVDVAALRPRKRNAKPGASRTKAKSRTG